MARGRPTKYHEDYVRIAHAACAELGATNEQLARLFGVGTTTLDRWIAAHEAFRGAIKKGKDLFDREVVEEALLRRACGYAYNERTRRLGSDGLELVKAVRKEVPP